VVSSLYEPFNKAVVAGRCEKSYDMKAADIIRLWSLVGDAASGFGTAMHLYMELFDTYGERGLPKHDFLKEIVLSFPWSPAIKSHTESLITSVKRGLCGMSDRLLELSEGMLVCDYKFAPGAEEIKRGMVNKLFPNLPNNKMGSYTCQLSVYAEMLEEAGIAVRDDVTIHVWDKSWTHHKKPRIKGILNEVMK